MSLFTKPQTKVYWSEDPFLKRWTLSNRVSEWANIIFATVWWAVIKIIFPFQPHQKYNTSHSMKNLAPHSLLRSDDYATSSHYLIYTFLCERLGEYTVLVWTWEWKGWLKNGANTRYISDANGKARLSPEEMWENFPRTTESWIDQKQVFASYLKYRCNFFSRKWPLRLPERFFFSGSS